MLSKNMSFLTLTVPSFAGPNDPAEVFGLSGADIPAELIAYYTTVFGFDIVVVNQYRLDATHYAYDALITQGASAFWRHGNVIAGSVNDIYGIATFGAAGFFQTGVFEGTDLVIGSSLIPGSSLTIQSGGNHLVVETGSDLTLDAGSAATYDSESIVATTSWTPTFSSSGGGFALGDGSVFGRYRKQGDLVWVFARLTCGATTTLGAGTLQVTLPFTPVNDNQPLPGFARDSSAAAGRMPICGRLNTGGSPNVTEIYAGIGGFVTNAVPFAPAVNDVYSLAGEYRTA